MTRWTYMLLAILAACRLYFQPVYSLISDCDETFNYWEPLNFLLRGFGKQTWEYSPEYSIRSWAFLLPLYSLLEPLRRVLTLYNLPSYYLFYAGRCLLGLFSLASEISLRNEIQQTLSQDTADVWVVLQILNPGWFHASVELLPSSFAMVTYLGAMKYTLRYLSSKSSKSFVKSLSFVFIGGVAGWPFSLLLGVPLVLHYILLHKFSQSVVTGFRSATVLALVSGTIFLVDSLFYGEFTPVAWNITTYNVIRANEKSGPNIFGTEPWYYYVFSLVLNFPFPTLLFCLTGFENRRIWPITAALIAWMAVFLSQPHKEERFLYPVYGVITLLASVGFTSCLKNFKNRALAPSMVSSLVFLALIGQSILRITALIENYTAPLEIYSKIPNDLVSSTVCVGREWYHFPASFFMPDNSRLAFVQSGFDGLLPGNFAEGSGKVAAIRAIPDGMNNENRFDSGKLISTNECDYYVDQNMAAGSTKDAFNPNNMPSGWKRIHCTPFIDPENSKFFGRVFKLPHQITSKIPPMLQEAWSKIYRASYRDYCLYGVPRETV
ncbi:LAMI_0F14620g1_1 [Lachancea mirantina]|uniref:Mannosyltransferase n=1 Tax=Lachancea mirantina TaxID=1230905 RepID=A0A1G4K424_9SACH|nr:LAMI_0F14620g1_1 [Lachancea mirantina]